MEEDKGNQGASARPTGLSSPTEPEGGLGPTGFDPSRGSGLIDGETYRNKRGDFRGPMRFVPQTSGPGYFVDQHGTQYYPDGVEVNHVPASTASIDLNTAGYDPEFDAACQREQDDRDDEAALYREQQP